VSVVSLDDVVELEVVDDVVLDVELGGGGGVPPP